MLQNFKYVISDTCDTASTFYPIYEYELIIFFFVGGKLRVTELNTGRLKKAKVKLNAF